MDGNLETNDLKRENHYKQTIHRNPNIGYQIHNQSIHLSSIDSAATKSENTLSSSNQRTRSNSSNSKKREKIKRNTKIQKAEALHGDLITLNNPNNLQKDGEEPLHLDGIRKNQQILLTIKLETKKLITKNKEMVQTASNKKCANTGKKVNAINLKSAIAHYKFGRIIQEHKKEFSNLSAINQQLREGQIVVKLSVYQIIDEEQLKELIRSNESFLAREVEMSYQNTKQFKKMKQQINHIKKNKLESQIEKKIKIQNVVYDSIYHLQINKNEMNAAQRAEANKKRKIKREEKWVQNQLALEEQQRIKNNLISQIINNASYNDAEDYEIEEGQKQQLNQDTQSQQLHNKYTDFINQLNDSDGYQQYNSQQQQQDEIIQPEGTLNNNHLDDSNSLKIEDKGIPNSQILQKRREENQGKLITTADKQHSRPNKSKRSKKWLKYIASSNIYIKNIKYYPQQYQFPNIQVLQQQNKKIMKDISLQLQTHVRELSPTNQKISQKKNQLQIFNELRNKNYNGDIAEVIHLDNRLLDSINSLDSDAKAQVQNFMNQNLYDWKQIYKAKVYYSSETQNIFNLKKIIKDTYDKDQLICFNTKLTNLGKIQFNPQITDKILEYTMHPKYPKTNGEYFILLKKSIADQIFSQYTLQEIDDELTDITKTEEQGKKKEKNEMYPFFSIFLQACIQIIEINQDNLNMAVTIVTTNHLINVPKMIKQQETQPQIMDLSGANKIYKIFFFISDEEPKPKKQMLE